MMRTETVALGQNAFLWNLQGETKSTSLELIFSEGTVTTNLLCPPEIFTSFLSLFLRMEENYQRLLSLMESFNIPFLDDTQEIHVSESELYPNGEGVENAAHIGRTLFSHLYPILFQVSSSSWDNDGYYDRPPFHFRYARGAHAKTPRDFVVGLFGAYTKPLARVAFKANLLSSELSTMSLLSHYVPHEWLGKSDLTLAGFYTEPRIQRSLAVLKPHMMRKFFLPDFEERGSMRDVSPLIFEDLLDALSEINDDVLDLVVQATRKASFMDTHEIIAQAALPSHAGPHILDELTFKGEKGKRLITYEDYVTAGKHFSNCLNGKYGLDALKRQCYVYTWEKADIVLEVLDSDGHFSISQIESSGNMTVGPGVWGFFQDQLNTLETKGE